MLYSAMPEMRPAAGRNEPQDYSGPQPHRDHAKVLVPQGSLAEQGRDVPFHFQGSVLTVSANNVMPGGMENTGVRWPQ